MVLCQGTLGSQPNLPLAQTPGSSQDLSQGLKNTHKRLGEDEQRIDKAARVSRIRGFRDRIGCLSPRKRAGRSSGTSVGCSGCVMQGSRGCGGLRWVHFLQPSVAVHKASGVVILCILQAGAVSGMPQGPGFVGQLAKR